MHRPALPYAQEFLRRSRAIAVASRHGHSVMSENQFHQAFMFALEEHAEIFRQEFGGEYMHPSKAKDALGAVEHGKA